MKEAEAKIWGAAHISEKKASSEEKKDRQPPPSTAQIIVEINEEDAKKISSIPVFAYDMDKDGTIKQDKGGRYRVKQNDKTIPEYAAFPLRPSDDERKQSDIVFKKVQKDVEFTLTITFAKDYEQEIRAALWAWETFGGIGARTRRGFGAIQLLEQYIIPENGNSEKKSRCTCGFTTFGPTISRKVDKGQTTQICQ